MRRECTEFDTPYGPAYVVTSLPHFRDTERPSIGQVVVRCPGHIVFDSNGMWYPEPYVIDYVLPRARAVADLYGVPAFEWLQEIRRDEIWAIQREFETNQPISMMMDFIDDDDYDGKYSHGQSASYRYKSTGTTTI